MKAKSVSEMIVCAAEQFAEWPCLGYRLVNDGIAEDKFTWYASIQCVCYQLYCTIMYRMKQKELYQIALYLGAGN